MKAANLNIGKQITLIEYIKGAVLVSSDKMGNFESVIANFDTIEVTGLSKPAKKVKYENMLLNAGFKAVQIHYCDNAGFEGNNSDVLTYSITYQK
jgi:hypothetical protein